MDRILQLREMAIESGIKNNAGARHTNIFTKSIEDGGRLNEIWMVPGSVGMYFWGGMAGTTFFVDPAQDLFAILMLQAPNQREYYRMLFRDLVYATLVD